MKNFSDVPNLHSSGHLMNISLSVSYNRQNNYSFIILVKNRPASVYSKLWPASRFRPSGYVDYIRTILQLYTFVSDYIMLLVLGLLTTACFQKEEIWEVCTEQTEVPRVTEETQNQGCRDSVVSHIKGKCVVPNSSSTDGPIHTGTHFHWEVLLSLIDF